MKYHQNGRNYRHLVQTAVREQISEKQRECIFRTKWFNWLFTEISLQLDGTFMRFRFIVC